MEHLTLWQSYHSINFIVDTTTLRVTNSPNTFKSCINRLDICPAVPTSPAKALSDGGLFYFITFFYCAGFVGRGPIKRAFKSLDLGIKLNCWGI
jgi:hypothetical protein